jgi:hypothetical protein
VAQSELEAAELQSLKEERVSTEKYLQLISDGGRASHHPDTLDIPPMTVTNKSLQECKSILALTAARLEKHLQDTTTRLLSQSNTTTSSNNDERDLARLQDVCITARRCLDICSKADSHLKDNANVIEDSRPGEGSKIMVTTHDELFQTKARAYSWRTRQLDGRLSDETVQRLSRDITTINMSHLGGGEPHSADRKSPNQCDQVER